MSIILFFYFYGYLACLGDRNSLGLRIWSFTRVIYPIAPRDLSLCVVLSVAPFMVSVPHTRFRTPKLWWRRNLHGIHSTVLTSCILIYACTSWVSLCFMWCVRYTLEQVGFLIRRDIFKPRLDQDKQPL